MTIEELEKKGTLYSISKLLGLTAPAVYKWRKAGKIPELRLFQLKALKPEWFA